MALTRLVINRAGVRRTLNSAGVRADLLARARRVAAAAGPGHVVNSGSTGQRARVEVVTDTVDAMVREAKERSLTRAVDSAR
jgi:hypothetical protein